MRPACRLAPTLIGARADREDPANDIVSGRARVCDKRKAPFLNGTPRRLGTRPSPKLGLLSRSAPTRKPGPLACKRSPSAERFQGAGADGTASGHPGARANEGPRFSTGPFADRGIPPIRSSGGRVPEGRCPRRPGTPRSTWSQLRACSRISHVSRFSAVRRRGSVRGAEGMPSGSEQAWAGLGARRGGIPAASAGMTELLARV